MQEDHERMTVTLARLVSIYGTDAGTAPEASEFAEDAINVQMALRELSNL